MEYFSSSLNSINLFYEFNSHDFKSFEYFYTYLFSRNMREMRNELTISTPGRICLFGEHQDYLNLPVIPCAISLRLQIHGTKRIDKLIRINLPDIHSEISFELKYPLQYHLERDYFRSAINVLHRSGFTFSHGFDCVIRSAIPIQAGTSSSSAMMVAWINFLARMSDQQIALEPFQCAKYAHEAEVIEFNEPGGMMDQFSTSFGNIIAIDFYPELKIEKLHSQLRTFVLGDSQEPKDTKSILSLVKNQVSGAVQKISLYNPKFNLHTIARDELTQFKNEITRVQLELLDGTILNRDLTQAGRSILKSHEIDHHQFGRLLNKHQTVLRDILKISTPKIDAMLNEALNAGAFGGKINGSGGGGCMFAYAPDNPERVADAIERLDGKAYIVHVDEGTCII